MNKLRVRWSSLAIALTLLLGPAAGVATSASGTQSFQISPPTANYAGEPGTSVKGVIKVTNLTDAPMTLTISKENFVAKGEEGEIELVDQAAPLYSLAPWFRLSSTRLELPGRTTKEMPYFIDIPAGAEPGGRYGSIVFSSVPAPLPSGVSGAAVQQTIAAAIFLRINGRATEELSVASFTSDKSFYQSGPVQLTTRVKNTGNVHEKPMGSITIKNMLGLTVDNFALDEHFVIPGAIRQLHNSWPNGGRHAFLMGRYTAELSATYAGGKTLTARTSFTVVPYKLLAIVTLGLLIIIFIIRRGRRRLSRALRILLGRE